MAGLGDTLAGLVKQGWDAVKNTGPGKFAQYEFAPESTMAPNERVRPGLYQGYKYELRPGESIDDAGNVYGADGQPVTFKDGPKAMGLADLFGLMTGGVAGGAPKGAVTSGFHRVHRDINPAVTPDIDYARDWLGGRLQAGHKRASQGYRLPSLDDASLEKMDKALTKTSMPSQHYLDKADRALSMGFDTPAYHFTNMEPDPEMLKRLAATPFREIDPFYSTRGSMYFGDVPSKIISSGAAQKTYGDPRMYPYVLRDVFGEHPLSPGLQAQLPESLALNNWGSPTDAAFKDLQAGMRAAPGYADNIGAAREAEKKFLMDLGYPFNEGGFNATQAEAFDTLTPMLQRLYYDKVPGGDPNRLHLMAPEDFVPAQIVDDGLPHYSQYEAGSRMNRKGVPQTGLHSPLQNEIGALGFSGSRVLDEMRNAGGKSFAMIDPAGVRSMAAKFEDPYGDLLSARVPATWMNGLFAPQLPDTEQR